jgi:hypothetical protein
MMRAISARPDDLHFPAPVRLRVGDRFVFLPTVERAIEWLEAPANRAVCERLHESLALLQAACESRVAADMRAGYHAFMEGVVGERLVFR